GFEVANASMYDGASATAEAVLMARRILPGRRTVWVSRALHPHYRAVIATYVRGLGDVTIREIPFAADGRTDLAGLRKTLDADTLAVVLGQPNVFGVLEDVTGAAELATAVGALTVTATAEPLAFALVRPPGACGADVAVAEAQSFGLPVSYGGPGVGLFATHERHVRSMPGRIVGETVDARGRRGFVLTLATREQHIRRERATSNICTNQGLCALVFERGAAGRIGWPVAHISESDTDAVIADLPPALRRDDGLAGFPEISELEAVRHFVRLSQWNYSAATTLYPLGSCTMKYNPVV